MVAYTFRMPAGIPGAVSRIESLAEEPQIIDATAALTAPLAFGKPVKTSAAGLMQALVASDSTALITGFLARPYPGGASTDPLGTNTAPTSGLCNRIKRGYFTTVLNYGTAAKDAPVYFRTVAAAGPTRPVGNVEAALDLAVVGVANGGNTGNGTIGGLSAVPPAVAGAYVATMLTATTFRVVDPNGVRLADGATGAPYTDEGLTFQITVGGTPMIAGDFFTITNTVRAGAVANAYFVGPADANGNVEIAYNI